MSRSPGQAAENESVPGELDLKSVFTIGHSDLELDVLLGILRGQHVAHHEYKGKWPTSAVG